MQLIAAVDKNWAIGYKGRMLVAIPADQKLFRQETMGKIVVMGRKTLLTLPGQRPLEGRINLILTRDKEFDIKGADICHSVDEAIRLLQWYKKEQGFTEDDIFIIGGQTVYQQFLPFCDTAHITYIDYAYEADTYLVNLEKEGWMVTESSDEQTFFNLCYEFRKYNRIKVGQSGKKEE